MLKTFLLIFGYLLGSIPFAVIISRLKGIDILKVGSKNPGAGNVFRQVGKKEGILVWFLDTLKGAGVMLLADKIFGISMFWVSLAGIAAVVGHCFSPFLKFKGGKGTATSGGVIFYLFPKIFPLAVLFFFLLQIKKLRKWWLLLAGLIVFGALGWFFYRQSGRWLLWATLILVGLGIIIHIPTIKEFIKTKKEKTFSA